MSPDRARSAAVVQLITTVSIVVIAVVLVRMDQRLSRNDQLRSLCAAFWGAPDSGDRESEAWEKTKKLVGVDQLDMLSFCRFYGE
jgi:hypothetical protein